MNTENIHTEYENIHSVMDFLSRASSIAAYFLLLTVSSAQAAEAGCADRNANQSVEEMIAQAGGIDKLLAVTNAQLDEFDKWFAQMQPVLDSGVATADVQDLYNRGLVARDQNVQLREALECRKGR